MRSVYALLAFAASALAYQLTEPVATTGWTTSGPNVVAWNKVSTDPANFTIVLVNQNVFPATSQVLAALVDGTLGKITVNPPSGGWKAGEGFQVNFVQDTQHTDTILAQSGKFNIVASTSTTFSTGTNTATSTGTGVLTVPPTSPTTPSASGTDTSGAVNPTSSDTSTTPQNNGASSMGVSNGVFAGLALLGALLA